MFIEEIFCYSVVIKQLKKDKYIQICECFCVYLILQYRANTILSPFKLQFTEGENALLYPSNFLFYNFKSYNTPHQ